MFTVNKNPSRDDLRKFGVAMLLGFGFIGAILFLLPWLKARDASAFEWTGTGLQIAAVSLPALGAALFLLSYASPRAAKPVYIVWMSATVPIGIVMTTIMLSVLFFVLLPVFALIIRLGDPLGKKLKAEGSYWEDYRPHEATIERMERPF